MANGSHTFLVHSLGKFPTILKNNPTQAKNNGKFEKKREKWEIKGGKTNKIAIILLKSKIIDQHG